LITFIAQSRTAKRQAKYLFAAYKTRLLETQMQLSFLQLKEQQARVGLDPPFVPPASPTSSSDSPTFRPLVQRSCDEQDMNLWSRRPDDPDFLSVRVGMGRCSATYQVKGEQDKKKIALPDVFEPLNAYASSLVENYASLVAPLKVKLNEQSPLAIVSAAGKLSQARELAHSIVCNLAYHHSPEDVRIIILAPHSQEKQWQWTTVLPHTLPYDSGRSNADNELTTSPHAVAIGPEAIVEQLPLISRELGRRELLADDSRRTAKTQILPHLVIVVDSFDVEGDFDPPPLPVPLMTFRQKNASTSSRSRLNMSPLKRSEMTLALSRGEHLGVSVLCICANKIDIPTNSSIAIDLDVDAYPYAFSVTPTALPDIEQLTPKKQRRQKKTAVTETKPAVVTKPQACIRMLHPDPPTMSLCNLLDAAPNDALRQFALKLQFLRPATTKRLELRSQVDLRSLFEPTLDLNVYNPSTLWLDPAFRSLSFPASNGQRTGSKPLMRIPIGLKIGDEVQYLDLLKDGPHGLLIGQTGSGKSELLQTIIASLALLYQPTEVTFLLIDYKAGLALEPYRLLPHTIGFLSNASSPTLIQRFITMLRAEAIRREKRLKEGKPMPRLIIVIDEFAEMAKRTETVLDELFTITRVGREIGMHLLLSAQRPEGIIGTKVRDYVQYRLCLRCASKDDSREVLGRIDAANLPVSIPGRGYLLHGDNQLDLFQAARSTILVPYS